MLSRERLKRQQAEQALKTEEAREQVNENNKRFRDRGKRGLLQRLRLRQKPNA